MRRIEGPADGADFVARVPVQFQAVAAAAAGAASGCAVALPLAIIDRAVVEGVTNAAGKGGAEGVFKAAIRIGSATLKNPVTAMLAPSTRMVAGVYGSTYIAANLMDVVAERTRCSAAVATSAKFATTTAVNMGASVAKDAAFARMYGGCVTAVPPISYALFAGRDILTIGGAFIVPAVFAAALERAAGLDTDSAANVAQLTTPSAMQLLCTPLHVLALSYASSPKTPMLKRLRSLRGSTASACAARSIRMLPAYGLGGVFNRTLIQGGREKLADMHGVGMAEATGEPVAARAAQGRPGNGRRARQRADTAGSHPQDAMELCA